MTLDVNEYGSTPRQSLPSKICRLLDRETASGKRSEFIPIMKYVLHSSPTLSIDALFPG